MELIIDIAVIALVIRVFGKDLKDLYNKFKNRNNGIL